MKFSVIVPAHNAAGYIREGLESIRRQTFHDYELIVICDSCDDNTADIAREYTDTVFEIREGRCARSRNKGLDEAQGQWVLFMDDDDHFMEDNAFEVLADAAEGVDVVAFHFFWKDRGITKVSPDHKWTAVWNKAWRMDFLKRIGARFPDWEHSDDDGFCKYVLPRAEIAYLDAVLYYYNFMREGSLTWQMQNGLISWDFPGREA